jgi:trehalose 6-phosphate phosphatase
MIPTIAPTDALFLDFDGTLVEIAGAPGMVRVDPRVPELLIRLQAYLGDALAIVSGRHLVDLVSLLDPYNGAVAGIHGLERRGADGRITRPDPLPFLQHARKTMTNFAASTPGIVVEDKGLGVALHFRGNPEQGFACLNVAREVAWLSGQRLAVSQGKMVVEVHPVGANKGRAVLDFLSERPFRGRRPIYIGDEKPDESGFVFVNHLGGTTILVGANTNSSAQFRLPSVPSVINWLSRSLPEPSSPNSRLHAAS